MRRDLEVVAASVLAPLRAGAGSDSDLGGDVFERWRMRNGEIAQITQRRHGGIAVGCPEGTDQVYTWIWGKTSLRAYALVEQLPDSSGLAPARSGASTDAASNNKERA